MQYTETDAQTKVWYVMRSLYRSELRTNERLQKAGIRTYLPMRETVVTKGNKRKRTKVPVVPNLLFVHSTQKELAPFMVERGRFQYTYKRGGLQNEPIIVPERQMEDFIRAGENTEGPLYFTPEELRGACGHKVKIVSGPLQGCEGTLMKVRGARAKRLVVQIPGTIAVAVEVSPEVVEIIQ